MNYTTEDGVFEGVMPDGDITNDEDEFFDAWADEYDVFPELEEDWL